MAESQEDKVSKRFARTRNHATDDLNARHVAFLLTILASIIQAARQARLSKALSAAYLSHQITQLEDKVQGAQASRSPNGHSRGNNGRPPTDHGGRGHQRGGRGQGRGGEGNGRSSNERVSSDRFQDKPDRWVLDTSALVFALPRIRSAFKNNAELVVPLEGDFRVCSSSPSVKLS